MTIFALTRDASGQNTFSPRFCDVNFDTTLSVGVEQTLVVPPSRGPDYPNFVAVFSFDPGLKIFVSVNNTATVPGLSFAATNSQLNPTSRLVSPGDTLHFITTDSTAVASVSFYASK